ncbi:MAG: manganese efflux pump [Deltaproteobacteria bacterium]|nr:manganese efflux pump [Deltaproteobacteria bacterium]
MDSFAVSIAAGLIIKKVTARHIFRAAFHFGLFQAIMVIAGWLAGSQLAGYLSEVDHWIAFALLTFIGAKMIREALGETSSLAGADPTRGWMLVSLSVATSIDALAVGLSFAMLRVLIWIPSLIIGVVAALMSVIGIIFGSRLGPRWKKRAEVAGGLLLIAIGIQILVSHLRDPV